VFELLDSDGDGVITHDEFEMLVEEVYNDRSHIINDAGVKFVEGGSWLGFLGLGGNDNPEEEEAAKPPEGVVDPDEIETVKPQKKAKRVREKMQESEDDEKQIEPPEKPSESEHSEPGEPPTPPRTPPAAPPAASSSLENSVEKSGISCCAKIRFASIIVSLQMWW